MDLTEEIIAQVKMAKSWDENAELSDFQIHVTQDAIYLVHLTTGKTFRIPDDGSQAFEVTNHFLN